MSVLFLGIGVLFFEQAAATIHTFVMEPHDVVDVVVGTLLAIAFSIVGALGTFLAWTAWS